jgi:basic membrane protein A
VVTAVRDKTWKSEQYVGSMADGLVNLAPLGKNVPQSVKDAVAKVHDSLEQGTFDPYTGPLTDQDGKVRIPAGSVLPLNDILSINWFVKGVEGTIPK